MSEILNSVRLKNKITIISILGAFAVVLAVIIGILGHVTADRHTHIFDYKLELNEDGSFSLVGLCTVENCESPYFLEENLEGVTLLSAISPTCSSEGNRVYTYTRGDITLKYTENLEKSAHLYDYELVTNGGIVYVNGKCRAQGCTEPYLFINNITEIKLMSVVEGTCFSPRQETFSFIAEGRSGTFVTLVDEDIPHTLNGLPCDEFTDRSGNFLVDTPGVKLLKNEPIPCGGFADGYYVCEVCKQVEIVRVMRPEHEFVYSEENMTPPSVENSTGGRVILTCKNSECTETAEEGLPAVVVGDTAYVVREATELHPQLVRYSYVSIFYDFKVEIDYEIGDRLSHNYVYVLEPSKSGSGGGVDVVGRCGQPECQTPEIREENVPATRVNTSTCVTLGQEIWTYEYNGQLLPPLSVPSSSYAEHSYNEGIVTTPPGCVTKGEITYTCTVNGCGDFYTEGVSELGHKYEYTAAGAEYPTDKHTGLVVLSCKGCEDEILYDLPKVVFGDGGNSEILYESSNNILLKYTHETEYGCTIVLEFLIPKE